MNQQQYIQTVLESRAIMNNMIRLMEAQERNMAHFQSQRPAVMTFPIQMPSQPQAQAQTNAPTQADIEAATRTLTYGEIESPINTSCPISYETFENNQTVTQIRHCRHIFNTNSILRWFETGHQCPVCRHDIRTTAPVAASEREPNLRELLQSLYNNDNTYLEYTFTFPNQTT